MNDRNDNPNEPNHPAESDFRRVPAMLAMVVLSLAAASLLASQLNRASMRGEWEIQASMADEAARVEKGSVAALLWEARSGFSDILWLKTDEYLHNGLQHQIGGHDIHEELREMMEEEYGSDESEGDGSEVAAGDHVAETDPHEDAYFPREARPWQGLLGQLSEQTFPVGEHTHTKNKDELLPWFRLVTLMNPNHTRAYRVGSFWLSTYVRDVTSGYEFALEGLAKNEDDPEMYFIVGRYHFYRFKDYPKALEYFRTAVRVGQEIPMEERSESQVHSMLDSYRHIAYSHKAMGNLEMARHATLLGLKAAPGDKALRMYLATLEEMIEESGSKDGGTG